MSSNDNAPENFAKKILAILPGGDCGGYGGCLETSCLECANAITKGASVALCPACKQEDVDKIAKIMEVEPIEAKDEVAFILCNGEAAGKERFKGVKSCEEAVAIGFERGECKSGCVGLGSCINFCNFGAMELKHGKVIIDNEKCNGCGACTNKLSCIQNIITMIPRDATNFIPCASTEEDEEIVRQTCGYGCIACGDCVRSCPQSAVDIIDNHAVIDYEKCVGCDACTIKCRKKIILDSAHDITELKEKVAFVKCSGGKKAYEVCEQLGIMDCKTADDKISSLDYNLCTTGCLGEGNCVRVCRYDAIHIENGTAIVDTDKCVGCKDCVYACPRNLIALVPYKGTKLVPCASTDDYENKKEVCDSCCIACEDCVNNCPTGAIYMKDAHAEVDTEICVDCDVCQYVCPQHIIKGQKVPEYNYIQQDALNSTGGGE